MLQFVGVGQHDIMNPKNWKWRQSIAGSAHIYTGRAHVKLHLTLPPVQRLKKQNCNEVKSKVVSTGRSSTGRSEYCAAECSHPKLPGWTTWWTTWYMEVNRYKTVIDDMSRLSDFIRAGLAYRPIYMLFILVIPCGVLLECFNKARYWSELICNSRSSPIGLAS